MARRVALRVHINTYLDTKIDDVFLCIIVQTSCYNYRNTLWSQADSNR